MSKLSLNDKTSRKQSPLSTKDYLAMELPVHLYMVALRTGRMDIEHWARLMAHVAMLLQLSAENGDTDTGATVKKAMDILTTVMLNYTHNGVWSISDEQYDELASHLSNLGLYYEDKPRVAVKAAFTAGAISLVSVYKQFGTLWDNT